MNFSLFSCVPAAVKDTPQVIFLASSEIFRVDSIHVLNSDKRTRLVCQSEGQNTLVCEEEEIKGCLCSLGKYVCQFSFL